MQTDYFTFLKRELLPAFGCTEPIALALCAAKARKVLGSFPTEIQVGCSGSVIKNALAVQVPRSGGKKGIEISVLLGALSGDPSKELQILQDIVPEQILAAKALKEQGLCQVRLLDHMPGLYINVQMRNGTASSEVEIRHEHNNFVKVVRNDEVLFAKATSEETLEDIEFTFADIYHFAQTCDYSEIQAVLELQISYNLQIAEEGLAHDWGAGIGKSVLKNAQSDKDYAIAYAAAGSDARMGGCEMPVIINSGSGNQGLTVSLPIIKFAELRDIPRDKLLRALLFANLLAEYQKQGIGRLSAYCGVVSAATAAVAGIAFLLDEEQSVVEQTIINGLAITSGMICDGAKASCAGKIAAAVSSAFMGYDQAKDNRSYKAGDGIVRDTIDKTIRSIGRIARFGMYETDREILNEMIEKQ